MAVATASEQAPGGHTLFDLVSPLEAIPGSERKQACARLIESAAQLANVRAYLADRPPPETEGLEDLNRCKRVFESWTSTANARCACSVAWQGAVRSVRRAQPWALHAPTARHPGRGWPQAAVRLAGSLLCGSHGHAIHPERRHDGCRGHGNRWAASRSRASRELLAHTARAAPPFHPPPQAPLRPSWPPAPTAAPASACPPT